MNRSTKTTDTITMAERSTTTTVLGDLPFHSDREMNDLRSRRDPITTLGVLMRTIWMRNLRWWC